MENLLTAEDFAPGEEECLEVVRVLRWLEGVRCPCCGSPGIWRVGRNIKGLRRHICRECGKYFTDLTHTIFERSRLGLWEWFYLIKEGQTRSLMSIAGDLERPHWTVWTRRQEAEGRPSCQEAEEEAERGCGGGRNLSDSRREGQQEAH